MPAQGATAPFGPFPGECFFFSLRFWARCVLWRLEDLLFWPLWTQTLVQTRSGLRCCILDGVGRSAVVPSFRHCHRPQSFSCVLVFHYLHVFFGGRGNEKYCAVHFPFFNRTCFSPTVVNKIFDVWRGESAGSFVAYNYFAELAGLGHGVECAGPKKAEHLSVNCSKTGPVPLIKSVTRAMCSWQASFKFVAAAFRLVCCERVSLLWSCVVLRFAWVVLAERAGGPMT